MLCFSGSNFGSADARRTSARTQQRVQDTLNDFMNNPSHRPLNFVPPADLSVPDSISNVYQPSLSAPRPRPVPHNRRKPQYVAG